VTSLVVGEIKQRPRLSRNFCDGRQVDISTVSPQRLI